MQPAVITFRPDNFLTVGLIGAVVYTAAVLAVQAANRAGWITLAGPSSSTACTARHRGEHLMVNLRILSSWPNWAVIPAMLVIWLVAGVLALQLVGSTPWHQDQ